MSIQRRELTGCCPTLMLVARPAHDIFLGSRSNFIVLVKGKMFGIALDRHTWMLELSWEPPVKMLRCMLNIVPLLDLSGTIRDLIPKKILCAGLA